MWKFQLSEVIVQRNREETEKKIISAVGRIISREGFGNIGINAVAREAKIDKVLIYRYFGGLEELLTAYAKDHSFWPSTEQLLGCSMEKAGEMPGEEVSMRILLNHFRFLRENRITQDILRWELMERNRLTDKIAQLREDQGIELLKAIKSQKKTERSLHGIAALIHAGITYLVLRSKTAVEYLGISIDTPEGKKEIEKAVKTLVKAYFSHINSE